MASRLKSLPGSCVVVGSQRLWQDDTPTSDCRTRNTDTGEIWLGSAQVTNTGGTSSRLMTDGLGSCFRISRSGRISACGRISNSSSRHNESRRLLGRPESKRRYESFESRPWLTVTLMNCPVAAAACRACTQPGR